MHSHHTKNVLAYVVAWAIACASAGCGSTVATSTGPSPAKCAVTLTAPSASIESGGATATVAVSTQPECTWNASSEANWISGFTPSSGQGAGDLKINVAANPDAATRQADVMVNGVRAQIRQEAAACRFDVSTTQQTFTSSGGSVRISITTLAGCTWTAQPDAKWISISSASTGTGSGSVTLAIAGNDGDARSGSVAIANRTVRISQDGKPLAPLPPPPPVGCTFTVTPQSFSASAAGSNSTSVSVTSSAGCEWSASSGASWISISSGSSGTANGTVSFSVASNPGAARTGTLSIAGQTVTVNQAATAVASCVTSVNPTSVSVPTAGVTNSSIAVTTAGACAWTATSNASWISIASGSSGSGNGTVKFNVPANTGAARTGTLTVGGQTVTITEAACSYTVSPTSATSNAAGGNGTSISVKASSTCAWTGVSNVNWITIVNGASDSGDGNVTYTVLANTGPARTGTLTVAGQTVTIMQNSGCAFTIAPTTQAFPTAGGNGGPVTVTTQPGCTWTAVSNASWISVTSGASGTGTGSVTFTVAANTGGDRNGTLTIAGATFSVSQQKK